MKSVAVFLALAFTASFSIGCSQSTDSSEPEGDVAEDLTKGGGIVFSKSGDSALQISIKVADGLKPSTKNERFVRLTVARGGKSFGMWCAGEGSIGAAGEVQKISCGDGVATVSNDDDESFAITFEKKDGAYEMRVDYTGDGTFYGDDMRIVQPGWAWQGGAPPPLEHIGLDPKKGEGSSSDPFAMVADLGSRLSGLLGKDIKNSETRPLPAQSLSFSLSNTMEVETTFNLSRTGAVSGYAKAASVLKTPGDLSSGLASASTIVSRVLAQVE